MPDPTITPILWYFADPMCSWCWGFSPVIARIKKEYGDRIRLSLNLGGLRAGNKNPMSESLRREILHHWQQVNKMTGQSFRFEGALPDGFVYDTEPPSRATLVVGQMRPTDVMNYFTALQQNFYLEGNDITQGKVLADIAGTFGLDISEFDRLFESDEIRERTQQHFHRARQSGVRGFPTTVWQNGEQVELIATGYVHYTQISAEIDRLLNGAGG
jgi:putative protein-disulfide isomerase